MWMVMTLVRWLVLWRIYRCMVMKLIQVVISFVLQVDGPVV